MDLVVHPCTTENKEAEREMRSSELRDWNREHMAQGKRGQLKPSFLREVGMDEWLNRSMMETKGPDLCDVGYSRSSDRRRVSADGGTETGAVGNGQYSPRVAASPA
jgi:hypothetical protein